MINKVQYAFFALLRSGLWNQNTGADLNFRLTELEWKQLLDLSVHHTVDGIVFDGILKLSAELLPPKSILFEWTVRVDRIERRNQKMDKIIGQQIHFFKKENLDPILLKGQGLAKCYDNPLRRICGDVDWYFGISKFYDQANLKIVDLGLRLQNTAGNSTEYTWNGFQIEHHSKMLDIHNPFKKSFINKLIRSEQDHCITIDIQGRNVKSPSALLSHVQVNAHILKHLLSFGIGFRQLCDSARVCYNYHHLVDGEKLKSIYKDLGIYKWIQLLHQVLHDYLGLQEKYLPFSLSKNNNADWMLMEIMQTGNFGFHDQRVDLSKEKLHNQREDSFRRIMSNFRRYFKYAPMEAVCFPISQIFSRFVH